MMQLKVSISWKSYGSFLALALLAILAAGKTTLWPAVPTLFGVGLLTAAVLFAGYINRAVQDQTKGIRSNLRASDAARVMAESDLAKKEKLLMAVVSATRELIANSNFEAALGHAVQILGLNMQLSKVNIYTVDLDASGNVLYADQLLRWENMLNVIEYRHPDFQRVHGLSAIWNAMARNEIVATLIKDIKDPVARSVFEGRGILSMAGIPIFVLGGYWGFVGFNDCRTERNWTESELSILRSFVLTLGSVIERSRIEQQMIAQRDRAEAASNAKSEFMANMSHELRTPMNGIIGFTDLVLATNLQKIQREYLLNVGKSAHNLLNVINDILDLSRIEAGKLGIDHTEFNLQELIEETAEIMAVKAQQKDLEFICRIDPTLPSGFSGDQYRIRQILINLVGNAVKFTGSGEIIVSVTKANLAFEEHGKQYQDIVLSVTDTGIGIGPAKIDAIFDSFTQEDLSTTRRFGGTGLGLTISKSLAELMGGTIDVISAPGKGSTFTLRLSLEITEEKPPDVPVVKSILREVLVVDDNETNGLLLASMFGMLGIACKICVRGKDALRAIREETGRGKRFDLIFIDHQMPEMDGIALISEIKRILKSPDDGYILMLSSFEKLMVTSEAEKHGIHKFLSKPVSLTALSALLSSSFENPDSHRSFHLSLPRMYQYAETRKVLVAEDDPINLLLIKEVLRKMNVEVLEAANGQEALSLLLQYDPELIFMDINMPVMDGYECTREIRRMSPGLCELPIIALTADAMEKDKERCLEAGMDDFLAKPFQLNEIQFILDKYLKEVSSV